MEEPAGDELLSVPSGYDCSWPVWRVRASAFDRGYLRACVVYGEQTAAGAQYSGCAGRAGETDPVGCARADAASAGVRIGCGFGAGSCGEPAACGDCVSGYGAGSVCAGCGCVDAAADWSGFGGWSGATRAACGSGECTSGAVGLDRGRKGFLGDGLH